MAELNGDDTGIDDLIQLADGRRYEMNHSRHTTDNIFREVNDDLEPRA